MWGNTGSQPSHPATRRSARSLHIVVVRILADVADIKNDGLCADVFPPVRCAVDLGPDLARLVDNRIGAVARVFHDLTLLNEDQSGTVIMAVPWHNSAGLDCQLAETQFAVLQVCRL